MKDSVPAIGKRHSRGYLPHFDAPGFTQFITFRLADSLPGTFLMDLSFKLKNKMISEIHYHRQIELYLDKCEGRLWLGNPHIADSLAVTIRRFDGIKYELHAWVIMPNHVHLLLTPLPRHSVSEIIHSIKSFSAKFANNTLGLNGRFWSPDYFDRFIRNRLHHGRCISYIEENPVKAGLCSAPSDWKWGSAMHRVD